LAAPSAGLHTEVVRGSPGENAVICGAGAAVALAYLWLAYPGLLVAGGVLIALGGAGLVFNARRGRAWRQQDALVRELWAAAKRIPPGRVLADPGTGDLLSVERGSGWLTLVVSAPPRPGRHAAAARYVLGHWGAPVRPPVRRHLAAGDGVPPVRPGSRPKAPAADWARENRAEVTADELGGLIEQVTRTAVLGTAE
jgi:hypothetical protein